MRRAAAADALALLLFVTVGLLSHGFTAAGYLRDALPLLVAWFAVGTAVGLYRTPSRKRLLVTWIVAVPAAWAFRAAVLGHPFSIPFLLVSLVFTLVFVVVARLVVR